MTLIRVAASIGVLTVFLLLAAADWVACANLRALDADAHVDKPATAPVLDPLKSCLSAGGTWQQLTSGTVFCTPPSSEMRNRQRP